ncbi:hypothetical protein G9A89_012584 [Geosiphon pyriformis]|nr:hypothetical protein G9A89_012584 [Geosiphon pyriformis]
MRSITMLSSEEEFDELWADYRETEPKREAKRNIKAGLRIQNSIEKKIKECENKQNSVEIKLEDFENQQIDKDIQHSKKGKEKGKGGQIKTELSPSSKEVKPELVKSTGSRKRWTPDEDKLLLEAVAKQIKFSFIAQEKFPNRNRQGCRSRWNILAAKMKKGSTE